MHETFIQEISWEREDWRNAGRAYRWYCYYCDRLGSFDVTEVAAQKAAEAHANPAVAEGT